jgi:hypothetical protein
MRPQTMPPPDALHRTGTDAILLGHCSVGPMRGLARRIRQCATHDYKRHGTTTLFAALNVLDGKVIGRCMQRHRHQEFIRFLNAIETSVPCGKLIHAITNNHATRKHPNGRGFPCQAHQALAQTRRVPLNRRTSHRHQSLPARDQRRSTSRPPDQEPRQDHRCRHKRAPGVRFYPLWIRRRLILGEISIEFQAIYIHFYTTRATLYGVQDHWARPKDPILGTIL